MVSRVAAVPRPFGSFGLTGFSRARLATGSSIWSMSRPITTGNSPRLMRRGGSVTAVAISAPVARAASPSLNAGRRSTLASSSRRALPGTTSGSASASAP